MSEKYIPLYRKYRPKTLGEVVGQGHIKKALANAISLNKISHAYFFTGPRGTGKTSTARILAKSLNCKEGPTVEPCGVCPSCVEVTNSIPIDVIEIDAASNRKVEDAQNILEKIQYVPVNGKYKIYIIDEVHMLTNHAFNALLKTLEEPPENVIFILATTEPHKVLETITSRCQRFDFRRITTDDIVEHLKNIAKLEKINIEEDALFTIAKNAAGGMRDSLALLDQVSVLDSTKKITSDDVNSLLGRLSFDVLNNLSDKIIQSKPQEAIEILETIYNSGNEPTQILTNLLAYFKNLLIVKNCQQKELLAELTQLNESQIKKLKGQIENIDTHQIVFLIERISYYIKEVKATNTQHLWLEIAMIDLANLAQNTSLLQLQDRLTRLEGQGVSSHPVVQTYSTSPVTVQKPAAINPKSQIAKATSLIEEKANEEVKNELKTALKTASEPTASQDELTVEANTEPVKEIKEVPEKVAEEVAKEEFSPMPKSHPSQSSENNMLGLWSQFLTLLNQKNPPTCAMVSQHANPVEFGPEKIILACKNNFYLKALSSDAKKKSVTEIAEEFFNTKNINFTIRMAMAGEAQIKAQPVVEKKKPIAEAPPSHVDNNDEDLETIIKEAKAPKQPEKLKDVENMPSDQVTMVMNLFDGKYID